MTNKILAFSLISLFATKMFAGNFVVGEICFETMKDKSSVCVAICKTSDSMLVIPEHVEWKGVTYQVEAVSPYAFIESKQLKTIEIPALCSTMPTTAFLCCKELEKIYVASGNTVFCDIDGVLFNSDRTKLLHYPRGRNVSQYSIPQSVTCISENAFFKNTYLQEVIFPNSLIQICNAAFLGCSKLASITLPNKLEYLGSYAFYDCNNLMTVNVENDKAFSLGEHVFSYNTCKSGHVLLKGKETHLMKETFSKKGFEKFEIVESN